MRRLTLLILVGCLLLVAGASALDGYDYYQTIEYAACDQDVYQQDIVIHRTTGTAYNETAGGLETWHIYVGEHCREDYGDIRFTDRYGRELAYYIWPDFDAESARVCVRLEGADAAGTLTIHYGNAAATTTSDISVIPARYTDIGDHSYIVPAGIRSVSVLVVAGGGASGRCSSWGAGGGGAGGLIFEESYSVTPGEEIPVRVGAGGNPGASVGTAGGNGDDSIFGNLIAIGGGGGGGGSGDPAKSGGSGGGGGYKNDFGAGTPGQGHAGGRSNNQAGAGGGGAGGPGNDAVSQSLGGVGGPGLRIWGDLYAVGGSGVFAAAAEGGSAGGAPGAPNTGNGGSATTGQATTGHGGSGIVIVSIGSPWSATPPAAITFSGEQETAAPPTTAFTATPSAGLAPLTVQFTDTSTGSPTAWAWTFGDGGTSTTQNPQHTYAAPGLYTVTLNATNEYGSDTETKTDYITVYGPVTAQFTANVTGGTAPVAVQFTDLSTGGPTAWSWSFGDGNTSAAQNPVHTYTTAGTHTVTLTASHPYDSDTETKTAYITVTVLQPFPGLPLIPRDLTGTGLYTDINGNNRLDYNDLTVFFQHLAWAKANQPTECFDFNGNGWLDYNDVITLFTTISGGA